MSRPFRHLIYDSLVQRLADRRWHDVRELEEFTPYWKQWLEALRRDTEFEVDDASRRFRLRSYTA